MVQDILITSAMFVEGGEVREKRLSHLLRLKKNGSRYRHDNCLYCSSLFTIVKKQRTAINCLYCSSLFTIVKKQRTDIRYRFAHFVKRPGFPRNFCRNSGIPKNSEFGISEFHNSGIRNLNFKFEYKITPIGNKFIVHTKLRMCFIGACVFLSREQWRRREEQMASVPLHVIFYPALNAVRLLLL